MSNDYYNATTLLSRLSLARSAQVNSILEAIASGFDLLPGKDQLNQNRVTYAEATGAANTYAIALTPAPASYASGLTVTVKISATNTGASTLNVNGLGPRAIKLLNGNDVPEGDLAANDIHEFVYNGTAFVMISPSRSFLAYQAQAVAGFGWGATGAAPVISNIDDTATVSGAYQVTGATTGTLPSGLTSGTVIHQKRGATTSVQTFVSGVDDRIWYRRITGAVLGGWLELYTAGNSVGTVRVPGHPSGSALMETGTVSGAGRYWRFASGLQVCAATMTATFQSALALRATWTYPAAFVAVPDSVQVTMNSTLTVAMTPTLQELGLTTTSAITSTSVVGRQFRINGMTNFGESDTVPLDFTATGRWF